MSLEIPVDLREHSFAGADRRCITFIPMTTGVEAHGDTSLMNASKLPDGVIGVRFFIRLRDGNDRPRTTEDLTMVVDELAPGTPFVVQPGVFRAAERAIDEDALQLAFVDVEALGRARFLRIMEDLAKRLSKDLGGQWIYAQAQEGGKAKGFLTVSSW